MFLKNKWNNMNIKSKIFISTSIIITLSFMILYMCIYIFMPRVYYNYKVNKIYSSIENLKNDLSEKSDINLFDTLDDFAYENNLDLVILEDNADNKFFKANIIYSSLREGDKNPIKIPFVKDNISSILDIELGQRFNIIPFSFINKGNDNKDKSLNITESTYIKELDKEVIMMAHVAVSPIDEANTIVALFFPFAIVAIITIAVTIALFYSMQISKPLIRINKVAKKMAALDFDNLLEIKGDDEIGQLSSSINLMNKNLKESFEELEMVNSKLTEEIEMERRLEKERSEFIATISHELKSPITIISGQLEGMIYNIGKYKDRDKYLKESYAVVENMRELVQEILHLSERENIDFKYNFTEVNISELVEDAIADIMYFIEDKKMILESSISKNVYISADEKLFKKVVANIIKNGIIHSPSREKIIIKLTESELIIENTGVIIPKEDIKEIFNAFYRVDKSRNRKTGGTGLGLYIVRTILDKHTHLKYGIESKENSVVFKIIYK